MYSFDAKLLLNVCKRSERSLFSEACKLKGTETEGGMESEDVPENVVKFVTEETLTLLNVEVTKPVIHFILYTLPHIRGEKIVRVDLRIRKIDVQ